MDWFTLIVSFDREKKDKISDEMNISIIFFEPMK